MLWPYQRYPQHLLDMQLKLKVEYKILIKRCSPVEWGGGEFLSGEI